MGCGASKGRPAIIDTCSKVTNDYVNPFCNGREGKYYFSEKEEGLEPNKIESYDALKFFKTIVVKMSNSNEPLLCVSVYKLGLPNICKHHVIEAITISRRHVTVHFLDDGSLRIFVTPK